MRTSESQGALAKILQSACRSEGPGPASSLRWRDFKSAALARLAHPLRDIADDQCGIFPDRQRLADQIALHRVAAFVGEEGELLLGLHALGNQRHSESMAKVDDGRDDRR